MTTKEEALARLGIPYETANGLTLIDGVSVDTVLDGIPVRHKQDSSVLAYHDRDWNFLGRQVPEPWTIDKIALEIRKQLFKCDPEMPLATQIDDIFAELYGDIQAVIGIPVGEMEMMLGFVDQARTNASEALASFGHKKD